MGIDEHELGHGSGRRRAGAHGDAHVGLLEGEHVVDAVAGHGHGVTPALQGGDHGRLLVGMHPAEHGGVLHEFGQFFFRLGQGAGIHGFLGAGHSGLGGDGGDGGGVVAGDDLDLHAFFAEVGEGLGGIGAHPLAEDHEAGRLQPAGQVFTGQPLVGVRQEEHAQTLVGQFRGAASRALRRAAIGPAALGDDLRRAQHPGPAAGDSHGAPLAGGGESDLVLDRPPRGVGKVLADGVEGRVAHGRGGGHRAQHFKSQGIAAGVGHGAGPRSCCTVAVGDDIHGFEPLESRTGLGDGAGLVDAEHVHAGEAFDRCQLAREHLAPGEGHGRDREGDAGEQHESLRHHGDQRGDRVGHALLHGGVHAELRPDEDRGHRKDRRCR